MEGDGYGRVHRRRASLLGLIDELGSGSIGLDTPVFVYLLEEHPAYLPVVRPIFEAVSDGRLSAVTSGLTLLEVLVIPLRNGDAGMAQSYEDLLGDSRGLRLATIDLEQIRGAARLRAQWPKLRTPDALQLAAALLAGCSAFVTNDRRLPSIPGLQIHQLKDYAA